MEAGSYSLNSWQNFEGKVTARKIDLTSVPCNEEETNHAGGERIDRRV
jgi:hypothetical protein